MYGGIFAQIVCDVEADILPFAEPDKRTRYTSVYRYSWSPPPLHDTMPTADAKVDDLTAQLTKTSRNARTATSVPAPVPLMDTMALRPSRRSCECGSCS